MKTKLVSIISVLNNIHNHKTAINIMKILFFVLLISMQCIAQGDLLITPKRIVFDDNKQKSEISLLNIGKDTTTYSVSFKQFIMTEQGGLEMVEKTDTTQMFADKYLRIFPRTITLIPGESQTIMVQCRRTRDMIAGEYRSHIWFRGEKDNSPLKKEVVSLDSNQMSVTVTARFGITIPVIIRTGAVNVSATLSDLQLKTQNDTITSLELNINRKGNISIYGHLIVDYYPLQGKVFQIGIIKGVGVYTTINKRNVSIPLNRIPLNILNKGKIKVRFTSSDDDKKKEVYAEQELLIKN